MRHAKALKALQRAADLAPGRLNAFMGSIGRSARTYEGFGGTSRNFCSRKGLRARSTVGKVSREDARKDRNRRKSLAGKDGIQKGRCFVEVHTPMPILAEPRGLPDDAPGQIFGHRLDEGKARKCHDRHDGGPTSDKTSTHSRRLFDARLEPRWLRQRLAPSAQESCISATVRANA